MCTGVYLVKLYVGDMLLWDLWNFWIMFFCTVLVAVWRWLIIFACEPRPEVTGGEMEAEAMRKSQLFLK